MKKELTDYRDQMLDRWEQAAREFAEACRARDPYAAPAADSWNAHQIASHVRDVDRFVYGERIRRTLQENVPLFKDFDADKWMAEHYDPAEPLEKLLSELLKSVENMSGALRELPPEVWSRESRHESLGGGLTLQLWVERSLAHLEEHLKALK